MIFVEYSNLNDNKLEKIAMKHNLPVYSGSMTGNIDRQYIIKELKRIDNEHILLVFQLLGLFFSFLTFAFYF